MDLEQVFQMRFSCRSFSSKPVPEELLEKIIRLCQRAPSAGNLQAFRVIIVRNQDTRNRLAHAALQQTFLAKAPVVLVVSASPSLSSFGYGQRGRDLYSIQDATIFAAYCELICTNFGLASVWIGAFSDNQVLEVLKPQVPSNYIEKPIALIGIGFPTELPSRFTSRISLDELSYSLD
ncbi:MAG: nitroreductase family protein [Candidatus Hodarchaeota archaeon]